MDSAKATDQVSFLALNNVMEGLYRLDKDNKAAPGVAESYKKSDDGKKYTFTLNKNANGQMECNKRRISGALLGNVR